MYRFMSAIATSIVMAIATPVVAQQTEADKVDLLFDALMLPDVLDIMRIEGIEYGSSIATDMFGEEAGPRWTGIVDEIYDLDTMQQNVRATLKKELAGDDLDAMITYFNAEPGRTAISLEVSARQALLDDSVEDASKEVAALAMLDETPRYLLLKEFVEINGLIETNVVGALNSNYAFYLGLIEGGALPKEMTPDIALQDVWSQEKDIRTGTTEWVYSFLMLAYQPMSDEDLQTYIAFSKTDAGQDLNQAMFVAFNDMFDDISQDLGLAASPFLMSQEL